MYIFKRNVEGFIVFFDVSFFFEGLFSFIDYFKFSWILGFVL